MAEEGQVSSNVGLSEVIKRSVTISNDDNKTTTAQMSQNTSKVASTLTPKDESPSNPKVESPSNPKVASPSNPKVESTSNPKVASTSNPKVASTLNPKVESTLNPKVESSIYPKDTITHPKDGPPSKPKIGSSSHPQVESSSSHPRDPNVIYKASSSQRKNIEIPAHSDEVSRLIAVLIASSSKRTQICTNAESRVQQYEEEYGEDQPEENLLFLLSQIESEETREFLSARGKRKALKLLEFQKRAQILYHYNEDYVAELTITIQNLINKLRKIKKDSQRAIDGIKAETDQTDAGNTKDMAHKQEQLNIVYQSVLKMVTRWRRKIDKFETAMKKRRNQLESRLEALVERYDAEMNMRQDNLDKVEEKDNELKEELDRLTKLDADTQKRWAGMISEIHVNKVDEAMRAKLKKPTKKGKGSKGKSKKKGKGKKGSKGKGGKGSKKSKGGKKGSKGTKTKGKSKGKGKKGKKATQESGEDTDGEGENEEEGFTSGEENTGDSRKTSKDDKVAGTKKHKGAKKTTKESEKEKKASTKHDKKDSKKSKAAKSPQAPAHKESDSVQGEYDNEEELMSEFPGEYDQQRNDSQAGSQTTAPAIEKKSSKGQGGKKKPQGGKSGKTSKKKK